MSGTKTHTRANIQDKNISKLLNGRFNLGLHASKTGAEREPGPLVGRARRPCKHTHENTDTTAGVLSQNRTLETVGLDGTDSTGEPDTHPHGGTQHAAQAPLKNT